MGGIQLLDFVVPGVGALVLLTSAPTRVTWHAIRTNRRRSSVLPTFTFLDVDSKDQYERLIDPDWIRSATARPRAYSTISQNLERWIHSAYAIVAGLILQLLAPVIGRERAQKTLQDVEASEDRYPPLANRDFLDIDLGQRPLAPKANPLWNYDESILRHFLRRLEHDEFLILNPEYRTRMAYPRRRHSYTDHVVLKRTAAVIEPFFKFGFAWIRGITILAFFVDLVVAPLVQDPDPFVRNLFSICKQAWGSGFDVLVALAWAKSQGVSRSDTKSRNEEKSGDTKDPEP
ncbi:hypothetical protein J7I84_05205 [Arthrobacter sp. ISL-85]|uniref:hypothetical protein n=1 Tax=Arthrobacter sp. ISL-85 TaxID=2819115 RepID=UPI001BE4F501|nr:hypothetical protein [Arthrobacter sp. ISL-85]MBT2565902.1 hypothetical protein [Arthrobacter sp. ISL-85]